MPNHAYHAYHANHAYHAYRAGDFTLDYNFQANFWGAMSSNRPQFSLPYFDTLMSVLPLAKARAAAPSWSIGQGFFGAAGQFSQGMQCGKSSTGWKGPLGKCPEAAGLGNYSGANFPGHIGKLPKNMI
jgi:hypothetical protein